MLVFTRMNRILRLDRESLLAVVEPGVITSDLQAAAEKAGLFYPPDPASLKTSTIGGNIAENAGGPRCFKYGVTGNYVLGLEAYLMSGEKIRLGSATIKNVAGYDLKSLLIGSEGTLAVVTQATLRLLPLPPCRLLFRVDFASLEAGARFVQRVIQNHVQPAVLEFMDRSSLQAVYAYQGLPLDDRVRRRGTRRDRRQPGRGRRKGGAFRPSRSAPPRRSTAGAPPRSPSRKPCGRRGATSRRPSPS